MKSLNFSRKTYAEVMFFFRTHLSGLFTDNYEALLDDQQNDDINYWTPLMPSHQMLLVCYFTDRIPLSMNQVSSCQELGLE
jgi:hypothetical protein